MRGLIAVSLFIGLIFSAAGEEDLTEAFIGTWKWGPRVIGNVAKDTNTTVVITKHSLIILSPTGNTAERWFSHPEGLNHVNAQEFVDVPDKKDVLCYSSFDELNPPNVVMNGQPKFTWLVFSKDRRTIDMKMQHNGRILGATKWTKISNDISEEAKTIEASLPAIKEAPSKAELAEQAKQDEENRAKALAEEKEKSASRKADAIAKAPIYHLKDGRNVRALSVMKAGDDVILKDEAGKMITVKASDVDSVEDKK